MLSCGAQSFLFQTTPGSPLFTLLFSALPEGRLRLFEPFELDPERIAPDAERVAVRFLELINDIYGVLMFL